MKTKWLWIVGGVVLLYVLLSGKKKAAVTEVPTGPGEAAPTSAAQLPDWLRNVFGVLKPTNSTAQRSGTGLTVGTGSGIDLSGIAKGLWGLLKGKGSFVSAEQRAVEKSAVAQGYQSDPFTAKEWSAVTAERNFGLLDYGPFMDFAAEDVSPFGGDWGTEMNVQQQADDPRNWVDDNYDALDAGDVDPVNDWNYAYV